MSATSDAKRRAEAALAAMSDAEDAAITAAAETDPDSPPLTDADLAGMRRYKPREKPAKSQITLRLDPRVVEHFRATGPGWQGRINETLMKAAGLGK